MSQTSIIAGALIVAFIIFVTVKGELPAYLGVLGLGNDVPAAGAGASGSTAGNSFNAGGSRSGVTVQTPTVSGSVGGVTVSGGSGGIKIGGSVGGINIGGAIPI